MGRRRFTDIDLAKGLAITLVVFGHVVAREAPAGNDWYVAAKHLVYQFHMPFFMFLSGAVFEATHAPPGGPAAYRHWVARKAARLLPGFALFSLLIWAGKAVASRFLHVDNAPTGGVEELLRIFATPASSVAGSLWYVYVLFEFFLVFPLVYRAAGGRLAPIVAFAACLHAASLAFPLPDLFAIDRFCEYALFFALGFVFVRHHDALAPLLRRRAPLFGALFALSFASLLPWPDARSKTLVGLCAIPALIGAVGAIRGERARSALLLLGEYTFSIYLMNTLCIGLAKGLLLEVLPWDGARFLLFFPVLFAAGLVGPLLLHRHVLVRVPALARITK
ncbi:MAG: acyltransferase [Proteobacteria bacterium]|nr:MAG: acyltransferase [Pseudomonadota bacterium]